ncbi:MAG: MmcQ/YjbR family DNA-binding protein, partial [Campylobacter sp.]|nr:MmcQ/YjbR family DNA-binding protein [Campylobacter sp.]
MKKISDYILKKFGVNPTYPWAKYPQFAVFKHEKNQKWFALLIKIDAKKTDFKELYEGEISLLNLKCDPELAYLLCDNDKISKAYHMNKKLWISINLNSKIDDTQIFD